jgi:hypothetical protein
MQAGAALKGLRSAVKARQGFPMPTLIGCARSTIAGGLHPRPPSYNTVQKRLPRHLSGLPGLLYRDRLMIDRPVVRLLVLTMYITYGMRGGKKQRSELRMRIF